MGAGSVWTMNLRLITLLIVVASCSNPVERTPSRGVPEGVPAALAPPPAPAEGPADGPAPAPALERAGDLTAAEAMAVARADIAAQKAAIAQRSMRLACEEKIGDQGAAKAQAQARDAVGAVARRLGLDMACFLRPGKGCVAVWGIDAKEGAVVAQRLPARAAPPTAGAADSGK